MLRQTIITNKTANAIAVANTVIIVAPELAAIPAGETACRQTPSILF